MDEENTKCLMCNRRHLPDQMNPVPKAFVPAAHFVFSCKRYADRGMYFPSLKFFIGPILAGLEVKGSGPVCRACRREAILWSIALYVLAAGVILMVIMDR